jgi:hypothetical protein
LIDRESSFSIVEFGGELGKLNKAHVETNRRIQFFLK